MTGSRQWLDAAVDRYRKRNLPGAEILCRHYLDQVPGDPVALSLLGEIALHIGAFSAAQRYYDQALSKAPSLKIALDGRARAASALEQAAAESGRSTRARPGFLLIKAWGYGFWSDVDHVLGQLLLAEMTGRVPVVLWGKNSKFGDPAHGNAFEIHFEPVSSVSVADLSKPGLTYFPPKWTSRNLQEEDLAKWAGAHSRIAGIHLLNRKEDVAVSDFHTKLFHLLPWLEPDSPYAGQEPAEVYRRLFARYIRLRAPVQNRIEAFWQQRMRGKRWLGVHVRGTDKLIEVPDLAARNLEYQSHIDRILGEDPSLSLYLLTDSEVALAEFRQRYGERLVCTDCKRSGGTVSVHHSGHVGSEIAEEVVTDVYLAARCDYFLGNGRSNVSTTVEHLKKWAPGTFNLIGSNLLFERSHFVYEIARTG